MPTKSETDQPKALWFKTKRYGWGWYPATWQGWLITLTDVILFTLIAVLGFQAAQSTMDQIFFVWIPWFGLLSLSTLVAYQFGEKPHWQWGRPKSSSQKETK